MPADELEQHGAGDVASWIAAHDMDWLHAPIRDFDTPDPGFQAGWLTLSRRLQERLDAGDRVLVHCRGGRGRSGMIAAALLIGAGVDAEDAIAAARAVRPGAIETPGQEAWLRGLAAQGTGSG